MSEVPLYGMSFPWWCYEMGSSGGVVSAREVKVKWFRGGLVFKAHKRV